MNTFCFLNKNHEIYEFVLDKNNIIQIEKISQPKFEFSVKSMCRLP